LITIGLAINSKAISVSIFDGIEFCGFNNEYVKYPYYNNIPFDAISECLYAANINFCDIGRIVISDQFNITDKYLVSFLNKGAVNTNGLKEFYNTLKKRRKLKGSLLKYFSNRGVNVSQLKIDFTSSFNSLIYYKYCESAFNDAMFIHFSDTQLYNFNLAGSINENNINHTSCNNLLNQITALDIVDTSSKEFIDYVKWLFINLLANLYNEKKYDCLIINDDFNGIITEEFILYNSPFKQVHYSNNFHCNEDISMGAAMLSF
jgi:hypothetical protein